MSLFVQHAYGKSDKIDNGIGDGNISGIILSPKAETPQNLEMYIKNIERVRKKLNFKTYI